MDLYDIAVARKLSGGGGGGGGATTKTVTGTLANPWGDIDTAELAPAFANGTAFASLDIDASALGFGTITSRPSGHTNYIYTNGAMQDLSAAYYVAWIDGGVYQADMMVNGNVTDLRPYASMLTTSMTVTYI